MTACEMHQNGCPSLSKSSCVIDGGESGVGGSGGVDDVADRSDGQQDCSVPAHIGHQDHSGRMGSAAS